MRITYLQITMIATLLLFGACSNEGVLPEKNPKAERTLSLTASMPDNGPTTRVNLTYDGNNVILEWEVGDPIKFLFVQGTVSKTNTSNVTSISNNGKRANFTIDIPEEIDTNQPFDLYGVYGGNEINESTQRVRLSQQAWAHGDLDFIKSARDVMLHFESKGVSTANLNISVSLKHLGSLFCINLMNSSSEDFEIFENFDEARLVGVGGESKWAYNADNNAKHYNLVTGTFENQISATNEIRMKPEQNGLPNGESIRIWAWFPPLPNVEWPRLELQLRENGGSDLIATSYSYMSERTAPTAPGKTYHFYAEWDGVELDFVDPF